MRQMTRAILLTPALIGLTLHPARAEETFTPPTRICGEFEYVREDGGVTARLITEDCVEADRTRPGAKPARRGRAGPGPAALGLAVVGVGLALAGTLLRLHGLTVGGASVEEAAATWRNAAHASLSGETET